MLSRRLLRVKIMQMVYSHTLQGEVSFDEVEKELLHSVSKSHELYHFILLLPLALRDYAIKRIETKKNKLRPSPEDLNPNTKFVENRLIAQLDQNKMLNKYVEQTGLSWSNDDDLLKAIYNKMCVSELYKEYMADPNADFESDRQFIFKFLSKELPAYNILYETLESKSVYWNDEIEFVISIVIKTLKLFDGQNGADVELMPLFKDDDDENFTKTLLRKSLLGYRDTIEMIKQYSKNWDSDRVATLDITIIRLAVAEMTSFHEIPIRVTLNEYIEISKYYSTEKSHVYINGILEKIVRYLVEQKQISLAQLK